MRVRGPLINRFVARVAVDQNGCWLWQGTMNWKGYGRISIGDREIGAHRVSYEIFVGPIPDGLEIDHLCKVRGCVNPDHLEPVTRRINQQRARGINSAERRAENLQILRDAGFLR
jgi:hypothetical protein